MKAVVFHEHGDVDVLSHEEVADPVPAPGEVKIQVHASALNHLDIWVRLGGRPVPIPMPHIGGCDAAGVVTELGEGVSGIKTGTRVVVAPGLVPDGDDFSRMNNDSASEQFQIFGFQRQGGFAEYSCVPARNVIPVSDRLSMVEWASVPLVFLTSWHLLFARCGLSLGETALIHAAGSGLGISGIQLANRAGARVITTVGSDEKKEKALALGADHVINYRTHDFVEETLKITGGQGVDVVYEHIGGETFSKSIGCIKRAGRMGFCGITESPTSTIHLGALYSRLISLHGSYMGSLSELKQVVRLAEAGEITPVIDSTFPLSDVKAAQQHMLDRKNFGKIVIDVAG